MADDELQPLLPPRIQPSTRRKAARMAILTAEMFERVAWYSFSGTLIYFLNKEPLCWGSSLAFATSLISSAVMYTTGLISGWLSDSYVGRYSLTIVGYIIYLIGYWYFPTLAFYSQSKYNDSEPQQEGKICNSTWFDDGNSSFLCFENIDGESSPCSFTLLLFLVFTAVGSGIVHTNLGPFGADQVTIL